MTTDGRDPRADAYVRPGSDGMVRRARFWGLRSGFVAVRRYGMLRAQRPPHRGIRDL